jgi:predicted PurR-regulated permease PerM
MDSKVNYNLFKNLALFAFVVLIGFFLYKIQFIVMMFFAAFVLASAIDPVINFFSLRIPRKVAIFGVLIIGLVLIAALLTPFITVLSEQIASFAKQIPVFAKKLSIVDIKSEAKGIYGFLNSLGLKKWVLIAQNKGLLPNMSQVLNTASSVGQNLITGSVNVTKMLLSSVMFVVTLVMLSLFMLMDKEYLSVKVLSFFPPEKREHTAKIFCEISKKVGGYLISQLVVISVVCLLVSLGLFAIKVEYALLLGAMAGILELIPVAGPITAVIIICTVAALQKPILALFALGLYIVTEQIVDNFVKPTVVSKFLNMHPLTFIFSLFVGGTFWGIIGLILAPALIATVCVLIDELYLNKQNGDATLS